MMDVLLYVWICAKSKDPFFLPILLWFGSLPRPSCRYWDIEVKYGVLLSYFLGSQLMPSIFSCVYIGVTLCQACLQALNLCYLMHLSTQWALLMCAHLTHLWTL